MYRAEAQKNCCAWKWYYSGWVIWSLKVGKTTVNGRGIGGPQRAMTNYACTYNITHMLHISGLFTSNYCIFTCTTPSWSCRKWTFGTFSQLPQAQVVVCTSAGWWNTNSWYKGGFWPPRSSPLFLRPWMGKDSDILRNEIHQYLPKVIENFTQRNFGYHNIVHMQNVCIHMLLYMHVLST